MPDNGKVAPVILFADDEEVIRMMGRDILHVLGYEVLLASNGTETVDIFEKNKENISLVLLDWHMPGMKGKEVLERLWEIDENARIILATGWGPPKELEELHARGKKVGMLQKPFLVKDLQNEIADFLAK